MGKIAFEIDDQVARAWKVASVERRKEIKNKIKIILTEEFFDNDTQAFIKYLAQRPTTTAKRTLTEIVLDEIFKDQFSDSL
jgi:hypothetical protein